MKLLRSLLVVVCLSMPVVGFSERCVIESEQLHVDHFQFANTSAELETIDICADRRKRVRLDVSGSFPKLETVSYQGSFGKMWGIFTGDYPELSSLNFECTTCKMDMDFRGVWHRDATIFIRNEGEPIVLKCPQNVGVVVHTKMGTSGKVLLNGSFVKKGYGVWNKTYHNSLVGTSPVTLTFVVESYGRGLVTLR